MDYTALLKRSWEITKKYRWLWWLGLFATLTETGGGFSFSRFNSIPHRQMPGSMPHPTPTGGSLPASIHDSLQAMNGPVGRVLGAATEKASRLPDESWQSFATAVSNHWMLIGWSIIFMLVLFLVWLYISYAAKAGLFLAVEEIETHNKELGFGKSYHLGRQYVGRLFGVQFMIGLIRFAIFVVDGLVLILPPVLAFFHHPHAATVAFGVLSIILGIVILIPVIIYTKLLQIVAERTSVFEEKSVWASIVSAHALVRRQFINTLLAWLVTIVVGLVYSLVILFGLLVIGVALLLIGFLTHAIGGWGLTGIYVFIVVIALIVLLLTLRSAYTTFYSTYWTLSYRALRYLHK